MTAGTRILGRTDVGRVRSNNEDAIAFDSAAQLAVLADGMGGLNAGEVASRIAADRVLTGVLDGETLETAVRAANRAVYEQSRRRREHHHMGTTLVALQLSPERVQLANVGDSRAYRFLGGVLTQLTHDHSLVQQWVDEGLMTAEQARVAPDRNIITRAVGLEEPVAVDILSYPRHAGERYLLCSDGLTDLVEPARLQALFEREPDPERLLDALVLAAAEAGGTDNVSVVLVLPAAPAGNPQETE